MPDVAPASIRFFCLVVPGGGLGFDYLEALAKTSLGVVANPIGAAYFATAPWSTASHLFMPRELVKSYVNVVAAPPGYLMGRSLRATDVKAPPRLPGAGEETRPFAASAPQAGDPNAELVYEPQTALSGLYTVGVPNIAITMPRPRPPEDHEVRALCQYDAVISPTSEDAAALRHLGITAFSVSPNAEPLEQIVREVMETHANKVCEIVS